MTTAARLARPARLSLHHDPHHHDFDDDDLTITTSPLFSSSPSTTFPSIDDHLHHSPVHHSLDHHHHQHDVLLPSPIDADTRDGLLLALIAGQARISTITSTLGFDPRRGFGLSLPNPIATPGRRAGYRSMTDACLETTNMTAIAEETPDSPPGLSYEKSPKSSSSSLRSDSVLSQSSDNIAEKLARYGEVAISDGDHDSLDDSNLKPESRPTLKRPASRNTPVVRKTSAPNVLRGSENRYPKPMEGAQSALREQSLNLVTGRSLRRGFTMPSSPSPYTHAVHNSSRSPSPTKPIVRNGVSVSPQFLSGSTTSLSSDDRSPTTPGSLTGQTTWQRKKKSIKELEAECDIDDDDDLPDDAVLENVPISPMPGGIRTPRVSRSNTPSPHRRGSWQAHAGLHSANVPKNAKRPSARPVVQHGQYVTPRSPRNSRPPILPHSATFSSLPTEPLSRKHRSKSWTEDLSEEARQLSAALEDYADRLSIERHGPGSGLNSAANSPPRPPPVKPHITANILELPPMVKGTTMIDPLPISKEKEAVLTRTRPSWLPPKSQKEERRHLREWEQMMARAAENEKKRLSREREARETREEMSDSIARIWDQHVLPNWDQVIKEPRTRELWWRGVTPRSRGVVWQKAIGNDLELSEASFEAALSRAIAAEEKLAAQPVDERNKSKEAAWFDAIQRDVAKVFEHQTNVVEDRPAFQSALADVLKAYAMYRSDVGYIYGTQNVASMLCLHMSRGEAFISLANILNRPLPLAFLLHDTAGMSRAYTAILETLKYKSPRLHDHLTSLNVGLQPSQFLDPLLRRLFASPLLPLPLAMRIWDIFVFEGDKVLVRSTVAILGRLEPRLYSGRDAIMDLLGWQCENPCEFGEEEDFVRAVREAGKVSVRVE